MHKTVRNKVLSAEVYGEGMPVVLLHGFTGSAGSWLPILDMLQGYQVIAVDVIGHGKSDSPECLAPYTMKHASEELMLLLTSMKVDMPVSVLGYSMGGRLALSFAMLFPDLVSSLILESSSPGLKTDEERNQRREQDHKLADEILQYGMEAFINKWENIPLFESQKKLPDEIRKSIREERLRNKPAGLAYSLKGMGTGAQPSWWDRLSSFPKDVLLITGEWDSKFCGINKEMQALFPKAVLKQVREAGHAIHVEQPRFFGKIVSEFLKNMEQGDFQ
ncbi:2-succinyl-6-hydroxy-2,4-cyclohexadiene-1-carboxylate synthase [Metabacillus sp. GX 13764]|uniref:2-succinyl-6-hydroxy-2, 4-cyclohexadiene-1-carboxylate synthase n=1 Tax=Metabacillus kandeliae TaxID=2900151 RepID=UPI001E356B0F|nr:2-succinyl-6-hydroxy-2,4-cyclohexadiene-1-carboxylate synthase [Metabacillus kandeliae]MCD7032611.1 2-succinyl-6-hydroxy-2,4-cyclohexadiene-1-carboxylate synthase [Metabacillus kandeliae]